MAVFSTVYARARAEQELMKLRKRSYRSTKKVAKCFDGLDGLNKETLPPLDVDALREAITWARKSKEVQEDFGLTWKQGTWGSATKEEADRHGRFDIQGLPEDFCNTSCCIAGSVAIRHADSVRWAGYKRLALTHVQYEGRGYFVSDFAQMYLGLTLPESEVLFHGHNGIAQVENLAKAFAYRRGLKL